MALQPQVNVQLRYGVEASLGVQSVAAGQVLRRVGSTINLAKDAFASNEVRPDQQVYDARHGVRRVAGNIQGELSTQSYDDLIEASLRGTWATGVTASQSDFTSIVVSSGKFAIGGGSWITKGFRVGDVIRLSGFSHTNVGRNYRITALTATQATVYPTPDAMSSQTTFGVAVVGKKLLCGTTQRSFTIEQFYPDIDVSETFLGCRIGEMGVSLPPTGMANIAFGVMGVNMLDTNAASAPVFANPAAAQTTNLLAGVNGSLSVAGAPSAIVTSLDLSVSNNLSSTPVVGSVIVPEIFYGRLVVTGSLSAYFADQTMLDYFLNETEISLVAQLDDANGSDFMTFRMNRVKLMGANKSVGPDGGVILQSPFQSLLSSGVTGVDDGSLVIQRSNA